MALPRSGRFSQSVTLVWTSGESFEGYALIVATPPTYSGTNAAFIAVKGFQPQQRVPFFARVPIKTGQYHKDSAIFFNEDLVPPNTRYVAYWYDATDRQIFGPSVAFAVTTDPFTPPAPTLTSPAVGSSPPSPDTPV